MSGIIMQALSGAAGEQVSARLGIAAYTCVCGPEAMLWLKRKLFGLRAASFHLSFVGQVMHDSG